MKPRRDFKRERWMAQYEQLIVSNQPQLAGKIDWNTATFFYNQGMTPELASVETLRHIWDK